MKSIFAIVLGVFGLFLVGEFSSWWVSLGVFTMLFGNNLERTINGRK